MFQVARRLICKGSEGCTDSKAYNETIIKWNRWDDGKRFHRRVELDCNLLNPLAINQSLDCIFLWLHYEYS